MNGKSWILAAAMAAGACSETPQSPAAASVGAPADHAASKPASKPSAASPKGDDDRWREVSEDELSDEAKARLSRARRAQAELASGLMGRLKQAIGDGDVASGVTACRQAAPEVQQKVAGDHLQLGRTSFRVRIPDNAPTDWQQPYVQARREEPVILVDPRGAVRTLSPIRLGEPCLACHGAAEQLAPGVAEALAEQYPRDQATGFAAGELRGWFWVEVEPAS